MPVTHSVLFQSASSLQRNSISVPYVTLLFSCSLYLTRQSFAKPSYISYKDWTLPDSFVYFSYWLTLKKNYQFLKVYVSFQIISKGNGNLYGELWDILLVQ